MLRIKPHHPCNAPLQLSSKAHLCSRPAADQERHSPASQERRCAQQGWARRARICTRRQQRCGHWRNHPPGGRGGSGMKRYARAVTTHRKALNSLPAQKAAIARLRIMPPHQSLPCQLPTYGTQELIIDFGQPLPMRTGSACCRSSSCQRGGSAGSTGSRGPGCGASWRRWTVSCTTDRRTAKGSGSGAHRPSFWAIWPVLLGRFLVLAANHG